MTSLLWIVALVGSFGVFYFGLKGHGERLRSVLIISITAISAFAGARLLHVFVENRELLDHPEHIWNEFDGMTFNGSLLLGFTVFGLLVRLYSSSRRSIAWDLSAIATAFSYGILRISCFIEGCCWGKISAVPWAVKYYNSRAMPWWGIPVHPVQLYDSVLSLLLSFSLFCLYRTNKFRGRLFPIFIVNYACMRFVTEFYRGDSIRGENILWSLSTSQVVSLALVALVSFRFLVLKFGRKSVGFAAVGFILTGCYLPSEPQPSYFKRVIEKDGLEFYETYKDYFLPKRNVIFVAADTTNRTTLQPFIRKMYRDPEYRNLGVEDLVWWQYAKPMRRIYNKIVRIPADSVSFENLRKALWQMESYRQSYDIVILSHGLPNHLSTGIGYFLSFRELANFKGQLPNANLVFMQSCFGSSLAQDWLNAGAKYVMAFDGFNRNFFFYGFLLENYDLQNSIGHAYRETVKSASEEIMKSPYRQLTEVLKQRFPGYTNSLEKPKFFRAQK